MVASSWQFCPRKNCSQHQTKQNCSQSSFRFVSFLLPPLFNKTKFHNFKIQNLQQQLGWIFSFKNCLFKYLTLFFYSDLHIVIFVQLYLIIIKVEKNEGKWRIVELCTYKIDHISVRRHFINNNFVGYWLTDLTLTYK